MAVVVVVVVVLAVVGVVGAALVDSGLVDAAVNSLVAPIMLARVASLLWLWTGLVQVRLVWVGLLVIPWEKQ